MLSAGHIGEYLLHHHNLDKHSQQGWESFNSLLKTFFFAVTHGTNMKSKIIPIAQWLSWHVLWLIGYDYTMLLDELLHVQQDQYNNENDSNESSSDDESHSSENDDFSDDIDDILTIKNVFLTIVNKCNCVSSQQQSFCHNAQFHPFVVMVIL